MLEEWKRRAKDARRDTYVLYLAGRDRRVPWLPKVVAGCVVAYALSPIDLIPDFIPIIGYMDDLIVIALGMSLVFRMLPAPLVAEFRATSAQQMRSAKATWIVVGGIISLWVGLAVAGGWIAVALAGWP